MKGYIVKVLNPSVAIADDVSPLFECPTERWATAPRRGDEITENDAVFEVKNIVSAEHELEYTELQVTYKGKAYS